MKKIILIFTFSIFLLNFSNAQSTTDSTGFMGDHFSMEGAIEIFKTSNSPEDFEKKINTKNNYVNNLDLNEDGEIDYIRVEDKMDNDIHAIVLQVAISESESQDIAVIEIEKTGKETAILQIIGDEDLYGEQKIVEPFEEEASSSGKGGPTAEFGFRRVVVNVYFWSPIRFIYAPRYRPWVSPYRWRTYPRYWKPWRPIPWNVYQSRRVIYHRNYHVVRTHRVVRAHRVYTPHRRTSVRVQKRTTTVRVGKNNTVRRKTTTTTVRKRNGKVVAGKKSTTKVKKKGNKRVVKKKTTKVKRTRRN